MGGAGAAGGTRAAGSGGGGAAAQGGAGASAGAGSAAEAGRSGSGGAGMDAAAGTGSGSAGTPSTTPAKQTVFVSGYGPNITTLTLDTATGMLASTGTVSGGTSPSYMAFSPDLAYAYAINEAGGSNSNVVAFSIAPGSGKLTQLNKAATGGEGAPHLAVHPSGKWIVVAHYGSGHISVLPIQGDGRVGAATAPTKGPDGGCKNAHQAVFDRTGDFLFVPCLGSNHVIQFRFQNGQLSGNDPATVPVAGGPRHLAFDPEYRFAYVLSEHESKITSFKYDSASGKLSDAQAIPSVEQAAGSSAHILVHPNGKWLYASNRTENSIGLFAIDAGGRPTPVQFTKNMVATPRDFSLDVSGRWLLLANQAGPENVVVFAIDPADGKLSPHSVAAVGGQPTFTQAVVLP